MIQKSKSTIKDVAKKTGYSIQTVSRVINKSPDVKESTRKIIESAIKELEYKPNFYARNLNSKKNVNVLISIRREKGHDATIWLNNLVNEIIVVNNTPKISIFVEQFYEEKELKKSLLYTTSNFIDGAVIFNKLENDSRISYLKNNNVPYVIFGKSSKDEDIFVASDDYNSFITGTKYLFKKGVRKIDFITGNDTFKEDDRERGIADTYRKKNVDLKYFNVIRKMKNQEEIYKEVIKKIENNQLPEAFFISEDEKAAGVLRALNEKSIKIPEEIMILGYDNIPISKYYFPSLSTIDLNYKKIADKLFRKIINLINGKEEKSEFVAGELIIRNSTK